MLGFFCYYDDGVKKDVLIELNRPNFVVALYRFRVLARNYKRLPTAIRTVPSPLFWAYMSDFKGSIITLSKVPNSHVSFGVASFYLDNKRRHETVVY